MNLSDNGYDVIKTFEGVRNKSYKDSVGIWTVGIGFITVDGQKVNENTVLTDDQIKEQFFIQIAKYEDAVNNNVTSELNQNQFDALVSFTFNLGSGALKSSTLLKKVNLDPSDSTIKNEFLKWNKAGGRVIDGLTKRRQAEANLYFS
jgi:lysozyme